MLDIMKTMKQLGYFKKRHVSRYSGADLRKLRKERGVGRPPKVNLERMFKVELD